MTRGTRPAAARHMALLWVSLAAARASVRALSDMGIPGWGLNLSALMTSLDRAVAEAEALRRRARGPSETDPEAGGAPST